MARFDAVAQVDPATPLVSNPDTILDVADLVLIDSPESGFSHLLPGIDTQTFRGSDADSAELIRAG